MRKILLFPLMFLAALISFSGSFNRGINADDKIEKRIDSVLVKMTLDEKIGQLIQIVGMDTAKEKLIRNEQIGSVLIGLRGRAECNRIQRIAVEETRLGIPLLFANDIIHGYHTIFPVPLAEASSWNPELVKESCRISAFESASEGTRWTYAPMVDIARDPRWGRIVEGSGEDPYLGSIFAAARVEGFQGNSLDEKASIAACPKHYVAYGGAEGGRDYNTVDISERTLREIYLPPFHAALQSGAASIMSAFNDLNGIPASANHFTLTEILRNEWNWDGVVISDYNAVGELIRHRFARDMKEAALRGFKAGVDIDMVGDSIDGNPYAPNLKNLVAEGKISEEDIDNSVRNVLRMKFRLGLFDNPYTDTLYFKGNNLSKNYKDSIALKLAEESIVLLKNENNLLPISRDIKRIALIGPFADDNSNPTGPWAGGYKQENVISVLEGLKKSVNSGILIDFVKGCNVDDSDYTGFDAAIKAARKADVVIFTAGESRWMSGEAESKTDLNIPSVQQELINRIQAAGKPIIVVLMNGRPLTINRISENIPAIIEAWYLGNQTGNAIARVIFGDYNPSGKLPVTFPRSTGQIPLYYYHKSTGRPFDKEDKYTSKYTDSPNTPLYPFGYGLSYTTFSYDPIAVSKNRIKKDESTKVFVKVKNTGKYAGQEVVQLYIRDDFASVTRPVEELKGFKKINLMPGETKQAEFEITPDMLSILDLNLEPVVEPGKFTIYIGSNSVDLISTSIEIVE